MKVKISDTESYWVVWNYPKKEVVFNQGEPDERIEKHPIGESFCFIYDDSILGEPKLVSTGVAVCGVKDRFSRAEGRLLAFRRAVNKIAERHSEKFFLFWRDFFNRLPIQRVVQEFKGKVEFPDTEINKNKVYEQ